MLQLISILFWVKRCIGPFQRGHTHCSTVMGQRFFSPVPLLLTESGRSTGDLRFQQPVCEFFDGVYLTFLSHQETKVGVLFPQFLQLYRNGGNTKLLLQLTTTVLEGLIVEKYDIGSWELFSGLSWYLHIKIFIQRCTHKSELILFHYLDQLLFGLEQGILIFILRLPLIFQLDPSITFVKFDIVTHFQSLLFNTLEFMLTMQPH